MNFGHMCATGGCDYRPEMDSDYCVLCNHVMRELDAVQRLNWQADEIERTLFPSLASAARRDGWKWEDAA